MAIKLALFIGAASAVAYPIYYLYTNHRRLSHHIHHFRQTHRGPLPCSLKPLVSTLPSSSSDHTTIHEHASLPVPLRSLPSVPAETLLLKYVRYTMGAFSRLPQSYAIYYLYCSPEQKRTFSGSYIEGCDFKVGDTVCGIYEVVYRTEDKVEFKVKTEGTGKKFDARLVVGAKVRQGKEEEEVAVFSNDVVMWKKADVKAKMPLEVMGWLHELFVWWLVDAGTKYLVGLEGKDE